MGKVLTVSKYDNTLETKWDDFVINISVNGTFLQTRNFLNYHPKERFIDESLIVWENERTIIAVCPGNVTWENGEKFFHSHQGSTYGGIIVHPKYYEAHKILEIIDLLESFLKQVGYDMIEYKLTPDIFSKQTSDLLQYCLYNRGYSEKVELSLYANIVNYEGDIISHLSQGKRTNVHNCKKQGMRFISIGENQIEEFYDILCETLDKYQKRPVHSVEELKELYTVRLSDRCKFYGIFLEDKMIAGAMIFVFSEVNGIHTQYLCARHEFDKLSPMSYLYFKLIEMAKEKQYSFVSWGITTEQDGRYLNEGLTKSKRAFGSEYTLNRKYVKQISD